MTTLTTLHQNVAVAAILLALGTAGTRAQEPQPAPNPGRDVDATLLWRGGAAGAPFEVPLPPGDGAMAFIAPPIAIAGETVTDAPYSAEAITEVIQTLADGNRIVRDSKTMLYRDSAGRTRREQGLDIIGPLVGGGAPGSRQVQISDPQAGVNYVLDVENRRAFKTPIPRVGIAPAPGRGAGSIDGAFEIPLPAPPAGTARGQVFFHKRIVSNFAAPVVERLGTQTLEGVEAQGTRSTMTIPAASIGNERPISIVEERWYSPELKALVLSRQSDPRYGETTYRLSNIVRSEPAADVFQVPPDFTIIEPTANENVIFRLENKN